MFERALLIHYHEIGLKGRNRSVFERRLKDNLDAVLRGLPVAEVERIASRLVVPVLEPAPVGEVVDRVLRVPGISSASLAFKTSRLDHDIDKAALLALKDAEPYRTFRVEARRSNTDYPRPSMDINRDVGRHILENTTGKQVDLSNPDVTCHIEVVQGDTYVYTRKLRGIGGLPVGTAGKIVALLSAGIDSPVATWRMIRRGAVVVGVHFSGRPQTSDLSERLVSEIGGVLETTGGLARIYLMPFGDLQKEISLHAPPDLRVLLYRRLMVRVAEAVARAERAKALVTGESLGQVASQTLDNIAAVDEAASLPVLRPLVGNDKLEIIAEARSIGTYDLSTQEHDDCCTLFMPRRPETHATVEQVRSGEADLDLERMVADAVGGISWVDFACPSYRPPQAWPAMSTVPGRSDRRARGAAPESEAAERAP